MVLKKNKINCEVCLELRKKLFFLRMEGYTICLCGDCAKKLREELDELIIMKIEQTKISSKIINCYSRRTKCIR